jgi:hypothetical protein
MPTRCRPTRFSRYGAANDVQGHGNDDRRIRSIRLQIPRRPLSGLSPSARPRPGLSQRKIQFLGAVPLSRLPARGPRFQELLQRPGHLTGGAEGPAADPDQFRSADPHPPAPSDLRHVHPGKAGAAGDGCARHGAGAAGAAYRRWPDRHHRRFRRQAADGDHLQVPGLSPRRRGSLKGADRPGRPPRRGRVRDARRRHAA